MSNSAYAHGLGGLGDPGDYFFHYTSADAAFGHILPAQRLRLSPYRDMRDPAEGKDWTFVTSMLGAADETDSDEIDQHRAWADLANSVKRRSKLLSLTIDSEDEYEAPWTEMGRGYARASMWERYADRGRGVCLVFSRKKLTYRLVEAFEESSKIVFGPVQYRPGGWAHGGASGVVLRAGESDHIESAVGAHLDAYAEGLFLTKHQDWAGEAEYRFVVVNDDVDYASFDYGDCLVGVIVGEEFPAWQRPSVDRACTNAGLRLFNLVWTGSRPHIFAHDWHESS